MLYEVITDVPDPNVSVVREYATLPVDSCQFNIRGTVTWL